MSQLARPQAITGSSLISRVPISAPEPVPWGWNPGATFVEAYNESQRTKMMQEKLAMEQELNSILFPAKKAQAEFTMKQLAYESERMENSYKLLNEETDERRRLLREGRIGGSGSNAAGSAVGGTGQQAPDYGPFSRGVSTPAQPQQQQAPPSRKLGSGLQPI